MRTRKERDVARIKKGNRGYSVSALIKLWKIKTDRYMQNRRIEMIGKNLTRLVNEISQGG